MQVSNKHYILSKRSILCEYFSNSIVKNSGSEGSCLYDTGGPLVTKTDGDSGYSLIGVVSFGDGCGTPSKYGVSTEFSKYLDWVALQYGLTTKSTTKSTKRDNLIMKRLFKKIFKSRRNT